MISYHYNYYYCHYYRHLCAYAFTKHINVWVRFLFFILPKNPAKWLHFFLLIFLPFLLPHLLFSSSFSSTSLCQSIQYQHQFFRLVYQFAKKLLIIFQKKRARMKESNFFLVYTCMHIYVLSGNQWSEIGKIAKNPWNLHTKKMNVKKN